METPIIYISSFINELVEPITVESVKKHFYDKSIMTKHYEQENLLLVYHKYDTPSTSKIEKFSRSLVIDTNTWKIISYTCQNPILNGDAQQIILNNSNIPFEYYRCYEGSLLSMFYHNDKWYLSSRRCLDASESLWNNVSHRDMFLEVLAKDNMDWDTFCLKLDKTRNYYWILIHHNLKNVVDYTKHFGESYSKLCLAFVRDKDTQEEYELQFDATNNIFVSEKVSIANFSEENKNIDINVEHEGIITKAVIGDNWYLLKLQSISYQFSKAMGPNPNIYKGYIYLYQNSKLKDYLEHNQQHQNFGKITNPYNSNESFDIVGVVDSVFKVLTSELFELFKFLWNMKTNKHQNEDLYKLLPKEYKDILFALRGLYYNIRSNNMKSEIKHMFGIKDIYNYLKQLNSEHICALLRQRKLILNWIASPQVVPEIKQFRQISDKCDKVHSKLIAIYINKLFPEILSTDLPQIKA
jgi:hypothetical protein